MPIIVISECSHQRHKIVNVNSPRKYMIFSQHNFHVSKATYVFLLIFNDERRAYSASDSLLRLENDT